jgi:hypothetical protein
MRMADQYACSCCGQKKSRGAFHEMRSGDRQREVTSRCRRCRSLGRTNEYGRLKFPEACGECGWHRRLAINGVCSACNAAQGLKQCRGECGELLLAALSFYPGRATCVKCYGKRQLRA